MSQAKSPRAAADDGSPSVPTSSALLLPGEGLLQQKRALRAKQSGQRHQLARSGDLHAHQGCIRACGICERVDLLESHADVEADPVGSALEDELGGLAP